MIPAHAASPRLQLDAKRIAGTSVAIAVHVGVLMMLMIPVQTRTAAVAEQAMEVTIVPKFIRPTPPTLPEPLREPRPAPATPQHSRVAPADPPVEAADQHPNAVSLPYVEAEKLQVTFDTGPVGPAFVQLATTFAPAPPYPRQAVTRRVTGTVTLRIHVDAGGRPMEVSVETSSGSALLDQAALKVVQARWRFVPATSNGSPVEAWALVPIEFVLD